MTPDEALQLADWRRQIAEIYASVRRASDPEQGWTFWRAERERLYLTHPQSPLPVEQRVAQGAPEYFPYQPELRVRAVVEPAETEPVALPSSSEEGLVAAKIGTARFAVGETERSLAVHWLRDYAGGIFVSFRDATSGIETYGAGRYLLDTAKGADLGAEDGRLILDFNFAYQPSCSYDPRWSCPLPPRENWLDISARAGERSR